MTANKALRISAALLCVSSWTAFPASAQWADMGILGGNVCSSNDVNDRGDAVGTCRDEHGDFRAVYWPNRQPPVVLAPLETAGPCQAVVIGNDGSIAGNCEEGAKGERLPVRWSAANPRLAPQRLNMASVHIKAKATLVNNVGVIVGGGLTNSCGARAVLWRAGQSAVIPLPELGPLPPLLPASAGCRATDVSDDLEPMVSGVCPLRNGGTVGVRWSPTTLGYRIDELARLPLGSNCETVAVNGRGQVAGTCQTATGDLAAVRWNPDMKTLTVLYDVGVESIMQQVEAVAMNELGAITGNYTSNSGLKRAFAWTPSGNPASEQGRDLGNLGGFWTHAKGIGDNGAIIGNAQDANGAPRAFRWTNTGISNLGTLTGGLSSSTTGISDNGVFIVGNSQTASGVSHAVGTGIGTR